LIIELELICNIDYISAVKIRQMYFLIGDPETYIILHELVFRLCFVFFKFIIPFYYLLNLFFICPF